MQILAFIAMIGWLYTTYKMLETKRYITAGLDIIALLVMSTTINTQPGLYIICALLNTWVDLRFLESGD